MMINESLIDVIKIIVVTSIFFVWVIRYANIVEEFKHYQYPAWLRDLVGILKMSCALMLINDDYMVNKIGAAGIALLMLAALFTHFKVKNPLPKMLPSFSLMVLSVFIYFQS